MENNPNERWHGAHHYSNKVHIFLIIFLFLSAITLFWAYSKLHDLKIYENIPVPTPVPAIQTPTPDIGIACTQEAMLCPDGSYVGRSGPNCEFTPCPGSGN